MNPAAAHLEIRRVRDDELAAAFAILKELRPQLDEATFFARWKRQEAAHGYTLHGAYAPHLVGLVGWREIETTARGPHLHVDDLVVMPEARRAGVGEALLEWVNERARERKVRSVYLDAIDTARAFYAAVGFEPHFAVLLRRDVA